MPQVGLLQRPQRSQWQPQLPIAASQAPWLVHETTAGRSAAVARQFGLASEAVVVRQLGILRDVGLQGCRTLGRIKLVC
jgi:hypothetical protein